MNGPEWTAASPPLQPGWTHTDRQTDRNIKSTIVSHVSARTSDSSETSSDCYSGEIKTFPLLVSLTGVIVGATVAKEKWNCFYIFLRVAAINNTAQNVYSVIEK